MRSQVSEFQEQLAQKDGELRKMNDKIKQLRKGPATASSDSNSSSNSVQISQIRQEFEEKLEKEKTQNEEKMKFLASEYESKISSLNSEHEIEFEKIQRKTEEERIMMQKQYKTDVHQANENLHSSDERFEELKNEYCSKISVIFCSFQFFKSKGGWLR